MYPNMLVVIIGRSSDTFALQSVRIISWLIITIILPSYSGLYQVREEREREIPTSEAS